jgi:hypothetical protein
MINRPLSHENIESTCQGNRLPCVTPDVSFVFTADASPRSIGLRRVRVGWLIAGRDGGQALTEAGVYSRQLAAPTVTNLLTINVLNPVSSPPHTP